MKTLLFIAAFCGLVHAEDLQLTAHWVEVPHERMTELLAEGRGDAALFETVRGWVKGGQARMVDTVLLRGKAGERAISESILEVIYPTEYEAPDLPHSKEYQEKVRRRMAGWGRVSAFYPMLPGGWTGEFETRNAGESLEVEFPGKKNAGKGNWAMDLVSRARDTVITEGRTIDGELRPFTFPSFNQLAVRGAIPSSRWQLSSVLTPQTAEGGADVSKKILVFVRVDVLDD